MDGDLLQRSDAVEESHRKGPLVAPNPGETVDEPRSPVRAVAQTGQIVNCSRHAGDRLETLRPGLQLVRWVGRSGPDLVEVEVSQAIELAEQDPGVRPEELVRRCHQEVTADAAHIDQVVRAGVDGIEIHQGSDVMGQLGDRPDIYQRPDRVRGDTGGEKTNPIVEKARDLPGIELASGRIEVGHANFDPGFFSRPHPRSEVGVVVETGDDDGVATVPGSGKRPADGEGDAGHVLTEGDLARIGVEEVGHGQPSLRRRFVGVMRCAETTAEVAHTVFEDPAHRVDHRLRYLGAAWSVEIGHDLTVLAPMESREPGPHRLDIE